MKKQLEKYLADERLWLGDYSDHGKYFGIGYYPDDIELKPLKDEVTEFFKMLLPDICVVKFCNFVKNKNTIRLTVDYNRNHGAFFEGIAYFTIDKILKGIEDEDN